MSSLDTRFYRELRHELEQELDSKAAELATGRAQSFDDYRHRVGVLQGLQAALAFADRVERRIWGDLKDPKAQG